MDGRSVVAVPFKVAIGFLILIFLWGFVEEEMSMSSPVKYEYEHTKKDHSSLNNEIESSSSHGGSYMPWRQHVRDRHMHLDTDHIRVGERVELLGLTSRADLNGVTGRVMEFDGKVYTVRLVHGIGRFRLKPENVKPFASKSSSTTTSITSSSDPTDPETKSSQVQTLHHHNNKTETLDRIEQLITPQHNHVESKHFHRKHNDYNQSNYHERLLLLLLIIILFCIYLYNLIPTQQLSNDLSIKCSAPTTQIEYVLVDEINENDDNDDEEGDDENDEVDEEQGNVHLNKDSASVIS